MVRLGAPRRFWTPGARLVRTGLLGALCAVGVFAAGRAAELVVLGRTNAATLVRVESDVRATFDALTRELRDIARPAADPEDMQAAASGDTLAARRLFDAAAAALSGPDESALAVTAYDMEGQPVAWGGRPSELPVERLASSEAWFVSQGSLGFRLVYVAPIVVQGAATRVGTVATERAIETIPQRSGFLIADSLAPVSIELPFEAVDQVPDGSAFEVRAPSGEHLLTARVAATDLTGVRARWRRATLSLSLVTLSGAVLLMIGPLLDGRKAARHARAYAVPALLAAAAALAARLLLRLASVADWWSAPLFSGTTYASAFLGPLFSSPFDFLATAATAGVLVALLFAGVEAWRAGGRRRRRPVLGTVRVVAFVAVHLLAGMGVAALLVAHQALLRDTIANTTLDLLHFSLHPWSTSSLAPRLALEVGLILWHATALGAAVLVLRVGSLWWRVPRRDRVVRLSAVACWILPMLTWQVMRGTPREQLPLLTALAVTAVSSLFATRLIARYRHGSQAFRLFVMTLGFVAPALAFYPSLFQLAWQAKAQLVETRYAPQALNQRQTIQTLVKQSLEEIDRFPSLASLTTVDALPAGPEVLTDRAFAVWRTTSLAAYPATSSVELYGPDGTLVSRFAFNLPDDLTAAPRSQEGSCTWDLYEEVAPFFAEERRVLHAGRAVCDVDGTALGSIVVHAILDYENLPFIASQSPYVELMRPADPLNGEDLSGRDVEYAVYGWSRSPLYASSGRAWPLDDAVFERLQDSRIPTWVQLQRGDDRFDVYVVSDRFGIYALGFPVVSGLDHLVNLAELTVLAWGTYLLLVIVGAALGAFSRRGTGARALLREIRASFYRKLFLAFISATVVPVAALALATSNYVADEMRGNVEQEAVRTASAARRVVEDLVAPRAVEQALGVDDNLMVWVSRLIDQDVNIFRGARLLATSERNLFASGLLPTRTPAAVYRDLGLLRGAATVTRERVGTLEYLLSATAMTAPQLDAVLTVPLTSRQQEIEAQIDTLNRRVLLGALLFVFCGAGLGYWLAERIADPVNRLTRATRRLARGDLDARVATTSSDELRRLVQDFNGMASELQRQRAALERTNRLEAWAEMARQVAHEIKNPLTPIQLNAEHLRRVHADRGEPLGAVMHECIGTILSQVALLRKIASEFSSFASSPTARPGTVDVGAMLHDVIDPYRTGLAGRITFDLDVPQGLPALYVDQTLVARALVNIVENALHAMPGDGTLSVRAGHDGDAVWISVSDTGVGMDVQALHRAFEPYFSTRAAGTGLGLPIAKRNVELSGGSIAIRSDRGRGTTVELRMPTTAAVATREP